MSTFRSRSLGQTVSETVDFFFNLLFMFPRDFACTPLYSLSIYRAEEGMSDKHNNKVAKEIENSKGWMQVIVQIISLLQHSGTKSNKSKSHKNT